MSAYATSDPRRSRKRKITRELLLRSLEIIGSIPLPLPPELPPSPPASRSVSPAPPTASSSKRKLDVHYSESDTAKRPKHAKHHSANSHLGINAPTPSSSGTLSSSSAPSPPIAGPSSAAAVPHQDYERQMNGLRVASVASASASSTSTMAPASKVDAGLGQVMAQTLGASAAASTPTPFQPVRRPRRGLPSIQEFDKLHDQYYTNGRAFKYSGDARFWSTFPPTHKHFKALHNPPPPGTPYHTHGGIMSRLESVDALICFAYSLWCQDYSRKRCNTLTWGTIAQFLTWCKEKWESCSGVREQAFVGLIHMIEAFIHQRKVHYAVAHSPHALENEVNELVKTLPNPKSQAAAGRSGSGNSQRTPPGMLPSPATLSANSTPTNSNNGGTPINDGLSSLISTGAIAGSSSDPRRLDPTLAGPSTQLPAPQLPPPSSQVEVTVSASLIWSIRDVVHAQAIAAKCMKAAQEHLSLPVLREHFPRTFGRMVYSTLKPGEEHEPDIEDEEGELFWPGQCVTGEGLGWVCLMGRAMVREFGRDIGYRGLEAVIPKPDDAERRAGAART